MKPGANPGSDLGKQLAEAPCATDRLAITSTETADRRLECALDPNRNMDPTGRAAELTSLHFVLILPASKRRLALVDELSKELSIKRQRETETILSSSLLSKTDSTQFYLWFHVDRINDRGRPDLLFHLRFMRKPSGNPPKVMSSRLESGKHAEWFMDAVAAVLAKDAKCFVNAELRLTRWDHHTSQQLTLPLFPAAKGMDVCGVEYVARRDTEPVRRFRWTRLESGMFDVWISFVSILSIGNRALDDMLVEAKETCVAHIEKVL
jgi:hypothetical protein